MKIFHLKKGKHHFRPRIFGLYWNKTSLDYNVIFDISCRYNLNNVDQLDTNKLIGIGYLSLHWAPHHIDSIRFGWDYNIEKDKIELKAYCYVNKNRIIQTIGFCDFEYTYNITMNIEKDSYKLFLCKQGENIGSGVTIPKTHNKKLSFLLEPYFGGNEVSPKDMALSLQRL